MSVVDPFKKFAFYFFLRSRARFKVRVYGSAGKNKFVLPLIKYGVGRDVRKSLASFLRVFLFYSHSIILHVSLVNLEMFFFFSSFTLE